MFIVNFTIKPTYVHSTVKFGMVKRVEEERASAGSSTIHIQRERGPSTPNFGEPPTYDHIRYDTQQPNFVCGSN